MARRGQPVHHRHLQIHQDQVERLAAGVVQGFGAVRRVDDVRIEGGEQHRDQLPVGRDVVDHQHPQPVAIDGAGLARPRLSHAGLLPQDAPVPIPEPELRLYNLLQEEDGDAYSRYNGLIRELVSFENALDHRKRKDALL